VGRDLTFTAMGRTALQVSNVVPQPLSRIHATATTNTTTATITTIIIVTRRTPTTLWLSKETTKIFTSVDDPRFLIPVIAITITTTTITTTGGTVWLR